MDAIDKPARAGGSDASQAAGVKIVNLALQGGGSHGAFTWGVLDRLLEEERLAFEGITATSAGAVNAVVLADGLAAGAPGNKGCAAALLAKGSGDCVQRYLSRVGERQGQFGFRP
jgi:hypothetical protein